MDAEKAFIVFGGQVHGDLIHHHVENIMIRLLNEIGNPPSPDILACYYTDFSLICPGEHNQRCFGGNICNLLVEKHIRQRTQLVSSERCLEWRKIIDDQLLLLPDKKK